MPDAGADGLHPAQPGRDARDVVGQIERQRHVHALVDLALVVAEHVVVIAGTDVVAAAASGASFGGVLVRCDEDLDVGVLEAQSLDRRGEVVVARVEPCREQHPDGAHGYRAHRAPTTSPSSRRASSGTSQGAPSSSTNTAVSHSSATRCSDISHPSRSFALGAAR